MGKQTPPSKPSVLDNQQAGLTFPCDFVIKIFGNASEAFEVDVLTIIRKHQPNLAETAIQQRPSKDGKYLALSITLHVNSREELDAIYRELTASPVVLMVL